MGILGSIWYMYRFKIDVIFAIFVEEPSFSFLIIENVITNKRTDAHINTYAQTN